MKSLASEWGIFEFQQFPSSALTCDRLVRHDEMDKEQL